MVLGKRLKGAFKLVMAAIKELKSEQLEEFQETGTWWYKPLNHSKIVQKKKKKKATQKIWDLSEKSK